MPLQDNSLNIVKFKNNVYIKIKWNNNNNNNLYNNSTFGKWDQKSK